VFGEFDDLDDDIPPRPAPATEGRAEDDDRGRRRGRGQRGRGGRSRDDRPAEGRSAEGRSTEGRAGEGRGEQRPPRREARPSRDAGRTEDLGDTRGYARRPPRSEAIDTDELDIELAGDVEGDMEDADHVEGHTGHKKIPTWQEAVGLLIDANMAARSSSPDRGHGGHRGRRGGRGGR
jgi:hypothetical protein